MHVSLLYEPRFYHQEAKICEWCKAMNEEIAAQEENNTWTIQPLPHGKKSIGCRWLNKTKFNVDGLLDKYKAKLISKGYIELTMPRFHTHFH